jgi:hypothetical protein
MNSRRPTFGISSVICYDKVSDWFSIAIDATYRDSIQTTKRVHRINQPGDKADYIVVPTGVVDLGAKHKLAVVMNGG